MGSAWTISGDLSVGDAFAALGTVTVTDHGRQISSTCSGNGHCPNAAKSISDGKIAADCHAEPIPIHCHGSASAKRAQDGTATGTTPPSEY